MPDVDLFDFVKQVLGAVEIERQQMGLNSFGIGDCIVVLETGALV